MQIKIETARFVLMEKQSVLLTKETRMKLDVLTPAALCVALAFGTSAYAQSRHDEKPHGPPAKAAAKKATDVQAPTDAAQTFELKDGGKVFVMKDGTMSHYDAAGKRVRMKDGQMMMGKDGSKMMMKNNAIWKQLSEHGTLKPGH